MRIFISRVEDVLSISGRGLVVVPGFPYSTPHNVKVGDALVLIRPGGSECVAILKGIELGSRNSRASVPLLFDQRHHNDLEIGTEIWADDNIKST